ncbi:hypothetical protein [Desulfosporosinus sp. FKA]|uniref:hypothetical protein n=1 Tax=Desulfosporosinus sp. FKA TaxID=1969834 RepID=UPI000B4A46B2|nr:hypothetical protein [Desulfosporosinus sp. FKA]
MLSVDHKEVILNLWGFVNRPGIDKLINFLNESDFFKAPCSTKHHLAEPGGLAEHSLHVYNLLYEKINRFGLDVPRDTITICGLGHDLCKVNSYQEGGDPCSDAQFSYLCNLWDQNQKHAKIDLDDTTKLFGADGKLLRSIPTATATILINWLKNSPRIAFTEELPIVYSIKDQLPLGHGEKSISILQDFIKLTDNEKLAIRWHMGAWDLSDYSGRWSFNNANKITPLVALLTTADFEASNILEREEVES